MEVIFIFKETEQEAIKKWQESLPEKDGRQFLYSFVENGQMSEDGTKLYTCVMATNDNHFLDVAKDITI